MFCTECGYSISSTIKFCGNCGTQIKHQPVELREPSYHREEPKDVAEQISDVCPPSTVSPNGTGPEISVNSNVSQPVTVRPWVRYWARIMDLTIFGLIVGIGFGFFAPDLILDSTFDRVFGIIGVVFALVLEAMCFTVIGTTPGKSFFKVTLVTPNGQPPSVGDVISRNLHIWWRGLGCSIPVISIVTLIFAYRDLSRNGTTAWDRESKIKVVHGTFGVDRWFIFTLFMLMVFLFLTVMGDR